MRRHYQCWLLVVCLLLTATTATAAPYFCTDPVSPIQKTVCSDQQLSDLYDWMNKLVNDARAIKPSILGEQFQWVIDLEKGFADKRTVRNAINWRIEILNTFLKASEAGDRPKQPEAQLPPFCANPITDAQQMICGDDDLLAAHAEMMVVYEKALKKDPTVFGKQKDWENRLFTGCSDLACLKTVYADRVKTLQAVSNEPPPKSLLSVEAIREAWRLFLPSLLLVLGSWWVVRFVVKHPITLPADPHRPIVPAGNRRLVTVVSFLTRPDVGPPLLWCLAVGLLVRWIIQGLPTVSGTGWLWELSKAIVRNGYASATAWLVINVTALVGAFVLAAPRLGLLIGQSLTVPPLGRRLACAALYGRLPLWWFDDIFNQAVSDFVFLNGMRFVVLPPCLLLLLGEATVTLGQTLDAQLRDWWARLRQLPTRTQWYAGGLTALWFLFVVVIAIQIYTDVMSLFALVNAGGLRNERRMTELAQLVLHLSINLWALRGARAVARLGFNPLQWQESGRFRRLIIAGAWNVPLMVGRPWVGWPADLAVSWLAGNGDPTTSAVVVMALSPVLAPLLLVVAGNIMLGGLFLTMMALLAFIVGVPVGLFTKIVEFENALLKLRYQRAWIGHYLMTFYLWITEQQPPAPPPDESKGARFAIPPEVAALHNPRGAAFGHVEGAPLRMQTEKHILIMASTRSGKGTTLIIPHLLRYRGSTFVLDPKGENARATGRRRAQLNDTVHYLDPFGLTGKPRSRFNPLSRFTPDNMDAESKALANALVIATGRESEPHWVQSAQQLVAGFILHVYTSPDIPPDLKDLISVRRLLLGRLKETLDKMMENPAADGLVMEIAKSFLDTPEREFGSIVSNAQRQTEILDNPYIAACLTADGDGEEVNFKDWQTGTMSVFLCLAAPKFPVFNRWLRLVLTAALDEMTDRPNPPPLPVCFMLDELATLGHLSVVENAVGLAAGYGVQLWSVFQDIAQMRELYKGRWASFIGNAGVRAVFSLDDYDTAEYWSKFLGLHLVETASQQRDAYGRMVAGENVSETMRPLLSPEDLMTDYATDNMLVLPQGQHPIKTKRVTYYDDEELRGLWDDPRGPVPYMPPPQIRRPVSMADEPEDMPPPETEGMNEPEIPDDTEEPETPILDTKDEDQQQERG